MLLAIAVFVVVTGFIVGGYVVFTKMPGWLAADRLDRRLRELSGPAEKAQSILVKEKSSGGVDHLVRGTDAGSWLANLIEQSGVPTSPGSIVIISAGLSAVFGLMAIVGVRRWEAALAAAVVGAGDADRVPAVQAQAADEEVRGVLPRGPRPAVARDSRRPRVPDRDGDGGRRMGEPVGVEFKKSFEQQNFGLPLKEALNQLTERVPLMDVKFFVTAVSIQRETGGNLAEILDNLSHVVRERFKILRQVRTHTAHGRFTGYVLLALPAALAVALSFISPEHIRALFTTKMGQTMLIGAIVMQTIGFFWIKRVIKIEV